jgi:hypothetical protein
MPTHSTTRHVSSRRRLTYQGQCPSGVETYAMKLRRSFDAVRRLYQNALSLKNNFGVSLPAPLPHVKPLATRDWTFDAKVTRHQID